MRIERHSFLKINICRIEPVDVQEQITQIELRFSLRQLSALHQRLELQPSVKSYLLLPILIELNVLPQLVFHSCEVCLECLLKCLFDFHALCHQLEIGCKLRASLAAQQVMNQGPRLRIKESALIRLVIKFGIPVNLKKRLKRHKLAPAQRLNSTVDRLAKRHTPVAVGDFKRAVVFGQTFVEPERRVAKAVSDQQVNVLVKGERLRLAVHDTAAQTACKTLRPGRPSQSSAQTHRSVRPTTAARRLRGTVRAARRTCVSHARWH